MPDMCATGFRGLVICLTYISHWMLAEEMLTGAQGLAALTILLLGYLGFEIWHQKATAPGPLLVIPPVAASILTFVLGFGITNLLYWLPEETRANADVSLEITRWMIQMMVLVIVAACSMWIGFGSRLGHAIAERLQRGRVLHKLLSSPPRVNRPALAACVGLSLIGKVLQVELGLYGYSSSAHQLIIFGPYREYLYLVDWLGKWALICLAMEQSAPGAKRVSHDRLLLWVLLTSEVTWGFLSGFKHLVLVPIGLVALAQYVQRGRFPRWFVPAVVAGLIAGFAIVEPYRVAWNAGVIESGLRGISSGVLGTILGDRDPDPRSNVPLYVRVCARLNLTYVASLGIEYAARGAESPSGRDFMGEILTGPAFALIPRILWDTKPVQDIGPWYTREVLGSDAESSTGMSAITYLNFAGGTVAVICGFLFVGIMQRTLFDGLRSHGPGGWMVLLGLLPTLVFFEGGFDAFFPAILRLLPQLVVIQYLLFQRGPSSASVLLRRKRLRAALCCCAGTPEVREV
jgi:hypothetical protein